MAQLIVMGICLPYNELQRINDMKGYKVFTNRINSQYYIALTWFYTTDFNYIPVPTEDIERFRTFLMENGIEDKIYIYNVN